MTMKIRLLEFVFSTLMCFAAVLLYTLVSEAQEKLVLAQPAFTGSGADFRGWMLNMRRAHPDRPAEILAVFREVSGTAFLAGGRQITCRYEGDEADALVIALNKVNLSTTSLEKRVIQRCQMDGKITAGSITGTVE
jgi:hypothetical protein